MNQRAIWRHIRSMRAWKSGYARLEVRELALRGLEHLDR
jgi:hypothetical protein